MWWGGLEYNNNWALLDGTVGHGDWYYAIGAMSFWEGNIPGESKPMEIVELYVATESQYHNPNTHTDRPSLCNILSGFTLHFILQPMGSL